MENNIKIDEVLIIFFVGSNITITDIYIFNNKHKNAVVW